jgi:hypothetical protein
VIVDINEAGTSVLSTKLSIDASEKTSTTAATAAVISDSALADDAEITIDIDQVGSHGCGGWPQGVADWCSRMSFLINPFAFLAAGGDFESIATVTVGSGGAASLSSRPYRRGRISICRCGC